MWLKETSGHEVAIRIPNGYIPRDYQVSVWDAMQRGCRRIILLWHRRSGKDITALNILIKAMCNRVGDYFYIFPTFSQGRKVIWDATMNDGRRILDFFPQELIQGRPNKQEMKIRFKNGSLFQIVGSDNINNLMGTNPQGIVFSEHALHAPGVWSLMRPILTVNGGWAMFISTPRGKNHFFDIWHRQKSNDDWFCNKLTVNDTGVLSIEDIDKERREGMSEDMIQQEYYCSFDLGIEGSYYSKILNQIEQEGHMGRIAIDPLLPVHTAWDLGYKDSCSIVFFQLFKKEIRIVDCYEAFGEETAHYVAVLQKKGYVYGEHIGPLDGTIKYMNTGYSIFDTASALGLNFTLCPDQSKIGGINAVRAMLRNTYFDENRTTDLIKALTNYRKKFNPITRIYSESPLHDWSSHYADAFRYMAIWVRDYGNETNREINLLRDQYARPF